MKENYLAKPEEAVRSLDTVDDEIFGAIVDNTQRQQIAEVNPVTLAEALFPIFSQIRTIIYGNTGGQWSDLPPTNLNDILDRINDLVMGDNLTLWQAEEEILQGDPVYVTATGGTYGTIRKADAADLSTKNVIGLANADISLGVTGMIAGANREVGGFTGLIPGEKYFLQAGGGIGLVPASGSGTFKMALGVAKTTNIFHVMIGDPRVTS